jgi:hypothetical protein
VLSAAVTPEEIRALCRKIKRAFSTLVKCALPLAQPSDQQEKYMIMPFDRVILTGRCREYTSLAKPAATATKVLCIKDISGRDPEQTLTSLQVPSAAAYLQSTDGYFAALRRLIALVNGTVDDTEGRVAVFCSGAVDEEEADLLSAAGIVLVCVQRSRCLEWRAVSSF